MARDNSFLQASLNIAVLTIGIWLGLPVSASSDPFLGYDGPVYPNPVTQACYACSMLGGDFNEDGLTDLSLIAVTSGVLIGNGDCTFSRVTLPIHSSAPGVIGDFNEDNHLDVAVADTGNGFALTLGNGDGTFGPVINASVPGLPTSSNAWGLAVGDFDGDNHDDAVLGFVGNDPSYPLAFFSGNGDGTFGAPTTFSSADNVYSIAVADFDEDGNLDFIADDFKVRLGNGNGTFADAGTFSMGNGFGTRPLLVSDFNDDTHADFATVNFHAGDVSVRLGNGDGTFGAEIRYAAEERASGLTFIDVDTDGSGDLVVSHADRFVSLLPGNGDGTFGSPVQIEAPHGGNSVVFSDFDSDGVTDLATLGEPMLAVYRGHGDGTFDGVDPAFIVSQFSSASTVAAAFGDLNRDGLLFSGRGFVELRPGLA